MVLAPGPPGGGSYFCFGRIGPWSPQGVGLIFALGELGPGATGIIAKLWSPPGRKGKSTHFPILLRVARDLAWARACVMCARAHI